MVPVRGRAPAASPVWSRSEVASPRGSAHPDRGRGRRAGTHIAVLAALSLGASVAPRAAGAPAPPPLRVVAVAPDGLTPAALDALVRVRFDDRLRRKGLPAAALRLAAVATGEPARGRWHIAGRDAVFVPGLPTRPDLADAGLRPGTRYALVVAGGDDAAAVMSERGAPLGATFTATFDTADAASPLALSGVQLRPDAGSVPVLLGSAPAAGAARPPGAGAISLRFSAPLDPRTVHEDAVTLHLVGWRGGAREERLRARVRLRQTALGATLLVEPLHPLPAAGAFEVRGAAALRGFLGDAAEVAPRAAGDDALLRFRTTDGAPRTRERVLRFDGTDRDQDGGPGVDAALTTASFDAHVPGAVAAGFRAGGGGGELGDFDPDGDVLLATNSPSAVDGAFPYRSIRIRAGVTVRLAGPLPARLLSAGDILVEGRIDASGARGVDGESDEDGALPPADGGGGGPGGGAGGSRWTGAEWAGSRGGSGGAAPAGGGGGGGGTEPTPASGGFGGGGGGGGGAFAGAAGLHGQYPTRSSWNGTGGSGGAAGGIDPTSTATRGGRDFHLVGAGGGGGGAGGNGHNFPRSRGAINGAASGGGGGGALLLQAAGSVRIAGVVAARGGDGGDAGRGAVTKYGGAGGGGGGGGTLAIYAGGALDVADATLDTAGGRGGDTAGDGWPGRGGDGGVGRIRLEDGDGVLDGFGAATLVPDFSAGTYEPRSGPDDPPTAFVGTWFDAGAPGAEPLALRAADFIASVPPGASVAVEIQGAIAGPDGFRADDAAVDAATGESLDPDRASSWVVLRAPGGAFASVPAVFRGRAYRFFRVRITFRLADDALATDPRPLVEELRIRFRY